MMISSARISPDGVVHTDKKVKLESRNSACPTLILNIVCVCIFGFSSAHKKQKSKNFGPFEDAVEVKKKKKSQKKSKLLSLSLS